MKGSILIRKCRYYYFYLKMETTEAGPPLRLTLLLVGVNTFGGLSYGYNTGTYHNIVRR